MKQDQSFGIIPMREEAGERQFLIVQHQAGHWGFPKGHAEGKENELDAAVRELAEETGLSDVEVSATPRFSERYIFTKRSGKRVDKTVIYFLGWVRSGQVRMQADEIQAFTWASADDILAMLSFDEVRLLFDRVLDHLNTV